MESIKELRKICQNKGYQEHITIRLYRIFSIYLTKVCLILGLKPNFITFLSFLAGITGGYLYLESRFLLGSILFFLFYVFDNVDGEVARYRKLSSKFGYWLDTIVGHLLYPYFFLTLGLGVFFQTGECQYIVLGAIAAIAKLIERSVPQLSVKNNYQPLSKNKDIVPMKIWAGYIGKFPMLFPAIFFCSLAGWEKMFLWFFAVYLLFFALGKVLLTGWRIYVHIK